MSVAALDYAGMTEAVVVGLAKHGDRQAFAAIMSRCNQRLFRIARAVVHDDDEAEDVLQEAYLRAFGAIGGFKGEASVSTWLTAITLNEARGRLRRRRPQVELAVLDAQPNVIALSRSMVPASPEAETARAETRRLLEHAVDRLPEAFRMVFLLRDVEDCSVEETAQQLEIAPATVKTRLHRARRLLRRDLNAKLSGMLHETFPFLGTRCAAITERVLARMREPRVLGSRAE